MTSRSRHMGPHGDFAFLPGDQLHHRRLTDDRKLWWYRQLLQILCNRWRPQTAHFLIIGKAQIDRTRQLGRRQLRCNSHCAGRKPFHIARPTTIELAVSDLRHERVALPFRLLGGDHIRVARPNNPGSVLWTKGRDKVGFGSGLIRQNRDPRAQVT